jgi:hypothetical protein
MRAVLLVYIKSRAPDLARLLPDTQLSGLPTAGGCQPSWHVSAGVAQLPIELPIIG